MKVLKGALSAAQERDGLEDLLASRARIEAALGGPAVANAAPEPVSEEAYVSLAMREFTARATDEGRISFFGSPIRVNQREYSTVEIRYAQVEDGTWLLRSCRLSRSDGGIMATRDFDDVIHALDADLKAWLNANGHKLESAAKIARRSRLAELTTRIAEKRQEIALAEAEAQAPVLLTGEELNAMLTYGGPDAKETALRYIGTGQPVAARHPESPHSCPPEGETPRTPTAL